MMMARSGAWELNRESQCIQSPGQFSPSASRSKESSPSQAKNSATRKGDFLNLSDCNDDGCSPQSGFGQGLQRETAGLNFEKPTMVGALGDGYMSPPREQHKGALVEEGTTLIKEEKGISNCRSPT
ncbi:hypothetical protein Ancab_016506 [Ancistrocladus abbreviatus]